MDRLFSPWRSAYIDAVKQDKQSTALPKGSGKSIFADLLPEDDEANLVVHRGAHAFIIMNLYPYNSGHLLVIPYKQTAALSALDDATKLEMMQLIDLGMAALQRVAKPHGFNVGANLGSSERAERDGELAERGDERAERDGERAEQSSVAGGSVESHLHFHIVPRWSGDTNFMPVLADTKVISTDMTTLYHRLRTALAEIIAGK